MKRQGLLAAVLITVGACVVGAQAGELPVDEESIVAEMEALIDATPDLDDKARETVRNLIHKGIAAHDAKQFDKAVEFYGQAVALGPLTDSAYYELAYTLTTMGNQPGALDAVIRALTLNPKAEGYHILKASILDDLGFREKAKEAYRELLEIQPKSYLGHLNFGITLSRTGDMAQAEAEFLRAIEIEPEQPSGYFHIALLCKTLRYNYDERAYLEKFLKVGGKDHRLQSVKERLEEMQQQEVLVDPEHPHPEIDIVEKTTRAMWESTLHKNAFPDARGYALTFEEEKDVYTEVLSLWRKKRQDNPEATNGLYDLLLRIDDAGFLDEYIWYHRQRVLGDRATRWMDAHRDRIEAFLGWARSEGLLDEEKPAPARSSQLDRFRVLPADLFKVVEESEVTYEIGVQTDRPAGLLDDDRIRFSRDLKLGGTDRIACEKASRTLDEEVPKIGARALLPIFRCFVPGEPGYEHGIRRAASLGLEAREIEFRPAADLILGEKVQLNGESSWLFYALAKAAWRKEPEIRERHGGSDGGDRASLEEEAFALAVAAGAYANGLEPDEPEESAEGSEELEAPPEPIPALDRLLEAIRAHHDRGYMLYEVVHKAYHIPLDRLDEQDAQNVADYLFRHVIFRTQAE